MGAARQATLSRLARYGGAERSDAAMAGYNDIRRQVHKTAGFVPNSCWIAHVLQDHGISTPRRPRGIYPVNRWRPCPADKREHIEAALRYLGMI